VFAPDSGSLELIPNSESIELVPNSMAMESLAPNSMEIASEEITQDSVAEGMTLKLCSCCSTIHGVNDNECCHLANRLASRCGRCGLVHKDYDLTAWFIYDMDKFDCKMFILDVEKIQMDVDTIILPGHVLKQMEDNKEMKIGA
jgi:hypothetical protein